MSNKLDELGGMEGIRHHLQEIGAWGKSLESKIIEALMEELTSERDKLIAEQERGSDACLEWAKRVEELERVLNTASKNAVANHEYYEKQLQAARKLAWSCENAFAAYYNPTTDRPLAVLLDKIQEQAREFLELIGPEDSHSQQPQPPGETSKDPRNP